MGNDYGLVETVAKLEGLPFAKTEKKEEIVGHICLLDHTEWFNPLQDSILSQAFAWRLMMKYKLRIHSPDGEYSWSHQTGESYLSCDNNPFRAILVAVCKLKLITKENLRNEN